MSDVITDIVRESNGLESTPVKITKDNALEVLLSAEITSAKTYDKPPVCFSIEGEKEYPVFTMGNISTITGKAKAGKSFFVSMVVSALIKGEFEHMTGTLPDSKRTVLFFDTEQSEYHTYLLHERIKAFTESGSNYRTFCLRRFDPKERTILIETAIKNNPDVGFVVIDGVRDICYDFMDSKEAMTTVSNLMRLSQDYDIHITNILHQNKGNDHVRGHLGSEMVNKSETVISVEKKEDGEMIVKPEATRNQDFEPFAFRRDDESFEILHDYDFSQVSGTQNVPKFSFGELSHSDRIKVIEKIFQGDKEQLRSTLVENLRNALEEVKGKRISRNKAEKMLKDELIPEYIKDNGGREGTKARKYLKNPETKPF